MTELEGKQIINEPEEVLQETNLSLPEEQFIMEIVDSNSIFISDTGAPAELELSQVSVPVEEKQEMVASEFPNISDKKIKAIRMIMEG
jgi:hypothetical protein